MTERAAYGSDVKYQREAMERPFMATSIQIGCIEVNAWSCNWQQLTTLWAEFPEETPMSDIVYLVGLIVIVMAILSFVGLR